MIEWTRFKDKLPAEGQAIKVNGQWPFTANGFYQKHPQGHALVELTSQARFIIWEFKPKAVWSPITLPEAAKQ